jgi:hypothetical protein
MMACVCKPEGTELAARRVALRPVEGLGLQAHSLNFLERSLIRYALCSRGTCWPEMEGRRLQRALPAVPHLRPLPPQGQPYG